MELPRQKFVDFAVPVTRRDEKSRMTRTVMTTTVSGHWAAGDSKAGVRMMENVEGKA